MSGPRSPAPPHLGHPASRSLDPARVARTARDRLVTPPRARQYGGVARTPNTTKQRGLLAATAAAAVAAATWAVRDYRSWRALGPGGLPPHPGGWLVTTGLRALGRDPLRVRHPDADPENSALQALPPRTGPRPRVSKHPVPHRVLDQHPAGALIETLRSLLDEYGTKSPLLEHRTSQWEKHHQAVCLRGEQYPHEIARAAGGEIAHLHPSDGSMHVVLGPADAQKVLDRGWGELHPLAGVQRAIGLPPTYVLVYPPRDVRDLAPIHAVLTAAVRHMTGRSRPRRSAL